MNKITRERRRKIGLVIFYIILLIFIGLYIFGRFVLEWGSDKWTGAGGLFVKVEVSDFGLGQLVQKADLIRWVKYQKLII